MDAKWIIGALILYLVLRQNSGTSDLFGNLFGTAPQPPAPTPQPITPATGAVGSTPTVTPGASSPSVRTSDPGILATQMLQALINAGQVANPSTTMTVDQWNWVLTNRVTGWIGMTLTDLSEQGITRDAAGQTPAMTAMNYATLRVKTQAGLTGLGIVDLRNVAHRKMPEWTM